MGKTVLLGLEDTVDFAGDVFVMLHRQFKEKTLHRNLMDTPRRPADTTDREHR